MIRGSLSRPAAPRAARAIRGTLPTTRPSSARRLWPQSASSSNGRRSSVGAGSGRSNGSGRGRNGNGSVFAAPGRWVISNAERSPADGQFRDRFGPSPALWWPGAVRMGPQIRLVAALPGRCEAFAGCPYSGALISAGVQITHRKCQVRNGSRASGCALLDDVPARMTNFRYRRDRCHAPQWGSDETLSHDLDLGVHLCMPIVSIPS